MSQQGWRILNETRAMLAVDESGRFTWVTAEGDALTFGNRASAEAVSRVPNTNIQAWRSIEEVA